MPFDLSLPPTAASHPKSLTATAETDPIAKALEAGLGGPQAREEALLTPFVPPAERQRRQVGPVIPHDWQRKLTAVQANWHSLVVDERLQDAADALLQAIGAAEEAADAVHSLRSEQQAERDEAVSAARAAAKAGKPIPAPVARDWAIEAEYREARFRELHKVAQRASSAYATTAKQIDPRAVIEVAAEQAQRKAALLVRAEKFAAEVAQAKQVDALLGDAAAALNIGPRWYRGDADAAELPGRATAGADAAVRWLSSDAHDVHAAMTDTDTTLPMSTRRWLAKGGENQFDLLCRLEASENYTVSRFTAEHAGRYQGSVLYPEERRALAERRVPLR